MAYQYWPTVHNIAATTILPLPYLPYSTIVTRGQRHALLLNTYPDLVHVPPAYRTPFDRLTAGQWHRANPHCRVFDGLDPVIRRAVDADGQHLA